MVKHLTFWMLIAVMATFIAPAFIDYSKYQRRIVVEVEMVRKTMGEESAKNVLAMTDEIFSSVFEDSGFKTWFVDHYQVSSGDVVLSKQEGGASVGFATRMMGNYGLTLFMSLYELTFRLVILSIWLSYSLPFVIAAAWDGIMQRKAKITSFQYTSPSVYNASWHVIIMLVFCSFAYFNTPLPVPPMSFPIMVGIFAFFIRSLLANIQRSA